MECTAVIILSTESAEVFEQPQKAFLEANILAASTNCSRSVCINWRAVWPQLFRYMLSALSVSSAVLDWMLNDLFLRVGLYKNFNWNASAGQSVIYTLTYDGFATYAVYCKKGWMISYSNATD